jgi:DNA topoisomerase-6 subunit B
MADKAPAKRKTAEEMAKEQKEISVSEFFEKNKHLLGFDNPTKALLIAIKEAVDNSLDACQEADMLPDIIVKVKQKKEDYFVVSIQDNGPGIVKEQVGRVFGKLLYGSKFHRLRQSRGQQGIGISACVLYAQLTTGVPTKVWTKTESEKKGHYFELFLNTTKNEPELSKEEDLPEPPFERGVKVEFELTGRYRKWVYDYLKQTSISNPFAKVVFHAPDGTRTTFPRSINQLPKPPKEMKPHPYGMEFGILQRMLARTDSRGLAGFLVNEFSSVGAQTAKEICSVAKLDSDMKPKSLDRDQVEKLLNAMQKVKVQRPPFDAVSPIGQTEFEKSLKSEFPGAEFIAVRSRDPEVYRGFPFIIEAGVVYGGDLPADQPAQTMRFANRVPLLYQAGACATTEAIKETDWKRYNLQQTGGNLPTGPIVIILHMAGVWVPFVSESKEAIAPYPEIVKEMKLALQDIGRELGRYLSGKRRAGEARRRILIFDRYAMQVAEAVAKLTGKPQKKIEETLKGLVRERIHLIEKEVEEELGAVQAQEGEAKKDGKPEEKKEKAEKK